MGHIEMTDLNGDGPYIYKADHLHMHGPSEHKFNGVQYDLEFHIVHALVGGPGDWKAFKDCYAVVGVLFKVDKISHPFIQKLNPMDFSPIDKINFAELLGCLEYTYDYTKDDQTDDERLADAQRELTKSPFYHYKGSLTTPPCADVVNWNVYKRVLPISREHLDSLTQVWRENLLNLHGNGNYRHCQPLNGRRVVTNDKSAAHDHHGC